MKPDAKLFYEPLSTEMEKQQAAKRTHQSFPENFHAPPHARAFLGGILTPASDRWAFLCNGKSGTTSSLRFLFQCEFGSPLSVSYTNFFDINSDPAPHSLDKGDVFRRLPMRGKSIEFIENSLKLTTVRHPNSRAVSAFLYFCRTNELSHNWMLADRIRINALLGFDWQVDASTPKGFAKFLEYIELSLENVAHTPIDRHWAPQVLNIQPDLYKPDIVGRCEELPSFFKDITERLNIAPFEFPQRASNQQDTYDKAAFLSDPSIRRKIRHIYEKDFTTFNYDI